MKQQVLVTGAGGFIGSHLCEYLLQQGFFVRGFTHYRGDGRHGWLEHSPFKKEIDLFSGDIRDFDSVNAAMKGCNGVMHLAALIGIPYSYLSPLAYLRTNVEGTYNVLQAVREQGVERVLVTSTSETLGTARYVPMDENHPLQAQSPYAASKCAADQLALSFQRSFGVPVTIVRPFNTYGPRQSSRAFIPTVIAQLLAGATELRLGNLEPTRDLTYIADSVAAFLAAYLETNLLGEVVHVGNNQEIAMGALAQLIAQQMGKQITFSHDSQRIRPENSEVARLVCDNQKMKRVTSWQPKWSLKKGLAETIAWYTNHSESLREEYHV